MSPLRTLALIIVAILGVSGCIQVEKLVKLKADGSGTVEETVVMSKEVVAQMKQMSGGLGALGGGEKPAGEAHPQGFKLLDEKKLKEATTKMGEGVTFVSATPVTTPKGEGYTAIYAFTDITKLRVNQDIGDSMAGGGGPGVSMKKTRRRANR